MGASAILFHLCHVSHWCWSEPLHFGCWTLSLHYMFSRASQLSGSLLRRSKLHGVCLLQDMEKKKYWNKKAVRENRKSQVRIELHDKTVGKLNDSSFVFYISQQQYCFYRCWVFLITFAKLLLLSRTESLTDILIGGSFFFFF